MKIPSLSTGLKFGFLLYLFLQFASDKAYSQAGNAIDNTADPRHETLSQQVVSVLFDQTIQAAPVPSVNGWTVRVNATNLIPTGISVTGVAPNSRVNLLFDASPAHPGQPFIIPTDVVRVSYNQAAAGSNTLTATAGTPEINSFGDLATNFKSKNNYANLGFPPVGPICSELVFFNLTDYGNVDKCAPVVMNFRQFAYKLSLRFRNSSSYALYAVQYAMTWGDGVNFGIVPAVSDLAGAPNPAFINNVDPAFGGNPAIILTARPTKNYPATTTPAPDICSWDAKATPNFVGNSLCNAIAANTIFANYDTDNANTGTLNMPFNPPAIGETTDRVCLGTNVNMRFTDLTLLNCRLAAPETGVPNDLARHIRIVYGSRNLGNNIPDIRVAGVPVTSNNAAGTHLFPANPLYGGNPGYFPTGPGGVGAAGNPADNLPDANGVIELDIPVTASTVLNYMKYITTSSPANHVVNDEFYVKLEYWDVCNPYVDPNGVLPSPFSAPVSIENFVRIVTKPVPLTTLGLALCFDPANGNAVNFAALSSIPVTRTGVKWYKDRASVGTATTMANGVNNLTFPAANYGAQGGIGGAFSSNNTAGRYHSVWATQLEGAVNTCESDPVEIVIVQQPRIDVAPDIPTVPTGNATVCNGPPAVLEVYTTSAPNTKSILINTSTNPAQINLPTENVWSVSGFVATVTVSPTTATTATVSYNISPQPNPLDNGNVSVRRGYVTTLPSPIQVVSPLLAPFTLPTYGITPLACLNTNVDKSVDVYGQSNGGTISGSPTICNGSSTGNMTVSGHIGQVLQWERQLGAGAFASIGNAGLTTITDIPPSAGTFHYRVLVQNNGVGGPCASTTTIVANQNTVTVNPVPPQPTITPSGATTFCLGGSVTLTASNVSAASWQWYKGGVAVGGATAQTFIINTVAQSGSYSVESIGIAPSNCLSIRSAATVVTVNALPTAANPTGGGAVCSGNPAPDIVWNLPTGIANFTINYTITKNPGAVVTPVGPIVIATNVFTIASPLPVGVGGDTFDYKLTSIVDGNGCSANAATLAAVLSRQVSIGGVAPSFVAPLPSVSPTATCFVAAGATDPTLDFTLNAASASLGGFTLTYKIDGGANRIKVFATNGLSKANPAITFSDVELDVAAAHTIRLVSIQTASGCLTTFNTDIAFTVNPLPAVPAGPVGSTYCSTSAPSVISVTNPGAGFTIDWYAAATGGAPLAGGTGTNTFTPPVTGATVTYFAETRNTVTTCVSSSRTSVVSTIDNSPGATAAKTPNTPAGDQTICASTATVTMTAAAVGSGGQGAWTIPGSIAYYQNFTAFAAGITSSPAYNGWSVCTTGACPPPQSIPFPANVFRAGAGSFAVNAGGQFEAFNTDGTGPSAAGEVAWFSNIVDISTIPSVTANVTLKNIAGALSAPNDYIKVFYKLNGGAETAFTANGSFIGNFANNTVASVSGLVGATLQIVVRISNDGAGDKTGFDDVIIRDAAASAITFNNPNLNTAVVSNLPAPAPGAAAKVYTMTWWSSSSLGVCAPLNATMTVTINSLPVVNNVTPTLCEDVFGGASAAAIDLTQYDISIADDPATVPIVIPANTVVEYYTLATRLPGNKIVAPITITNGLVVFTRVRNTVTTCINDGTATFTIRTLPAKADQSVQICENSPPGSFVATGINLQSYETAIAGGSMVNRDIEWHTAPAMLPADLIPPGVAAGAEQNYTISADVTLYAKIIDTASPTSPKCYRQGTLTLDYQARPANNLITDGVGTPLGPTYTICKSSNLVLLQINPGTNPGSTYNWVVPAPSYAGEFQLLSGTTGLFIILRFPNPIPGAGTLYPTGVPISFTESYGTVPCPGNTINTRIIVEDSPPQPIISGPSSVCSGQNGIVFTVTNPVAGTYAWTLPPGATITSLPVTASSITVQMSTFSGNVAVTHSSGTGCTSPPSANYPVSIVNRPIITSANTNAMCSGQNISAIHTLTSNIVGTTYNWLVTNISGTVTGTFLGDNATGVISINKTISNTTGVPATITYLVTPVGPGPDFCVGAAQSLDITVQPQPIIVAGQTKTICSGAAVNYHVNLTPATLPANTQYSWGLPSMSAGGAQGTTGANVAESNALTITDVLTNTTGAPITATYTITPTVNGGLNCTTLPPVDVVITINPQPVGGPITRTAQCSGVAFSVSADNVTNGVASNFTWVRNALPGGLTQVTGGTGVGAIAETLRNLTTGQLSATYTVTPTASAAAPANCTGATYVVTVPINPEPVGTPITRTAQCSNVAFSVSADNITNSVASTFTWVRSALPGGLTQVTAGTGIGPIAETLRNLTGGQLSATYTVTPTASAAAPANCAGQTYVVTVPINPEPVGVAITRTAQCSNVAFSVSADNVTNTVASNFTWVRNALPPGLTQVTAGTGSGPIAETLRNLTGGSLSATYTVTPTASAAAPANCAGQTYIVTVPVNPEPVGAAITRTDQCSNVAFSVSADNITNAVASSFTWVRNALPPGLTQVTAGTGTGAIAETLRNLTAGQLSATYTVTPTATAAAPANCTGQTYVITVPVNPEPVGSATTRAAQCSNVAFSVSADNVTNGVASNFTWVRNALPVGLTQVTAGTGIGAIAETLRNLTAAQLSATYTVTPTASAAAPANCAGQTYIITVPINPEPVGTAITRTAQCSNVAFSVSADNITNGIPSTFAWVRNALPAGLTQVTAGTGIGAIAETLRNLTGAQISATYTVTPTASAAAPANCTGQTYIITVPINPEPVGTPITRVAQCSNVAFSVSADNVSNGITSTFTWVRNALPPGLTQVTPGTGVGAIAETLRNLTSGQLSATYTVTPTASAAAPANCAGQTYVITVPINPEPVGTAITRTAQCSNVAFSVSADNITNSVVSTFTWSRNPLPAGLTPVVSGTGVGAIAETLQNLTSGLLNATYTVTPTASAAAPANCAGQTYIITVPVNPQPVGGPITRTAQCSNVAFSVSADNISNGVATSFTWVRNALPIGLTQVVGGTGIGAIAETLQNLTNGQLSATYVVTPTASAAAPANCVGQTYVVTVPVNPEPVGTLVTRAAQCSNVAFSVSADNITNGVASTFTWVRNALPPGLTVVTAGTGTGAIAETLRNLTGAQLSATYTVTPQALAAAPANCTGSTYVVTVPVNPEPVGTAITRTAQCSNVAFSVSADNITNGVASTFTWVRNALPAGLTQVTGGTGVGAIAETLRNLTAAQLSATYVVTPTASAVAPANCAGQTYVITVPVNPEPVGAPITQTAQCSNVAFSVSANNITNGVASSFAWVRNALPAGLTQVTAGTGIGPIAETLRNLTSGQLSATYTVTPTATAAAPANCTGATYVVTVPVNPEPVGTAITRTAQCSNVAFSVSADNITNGVASTFTWVRNALPPGLTQITAGSGSGAIAETLENLTSGQLSATYVVTPKASAAAPANCDGQTYVVTVPVNPRPVGAPITRAAQCSNVAFSVSADNVINGVASSFTWVRNALPAGLTQVTAGTGIGAIAETLRNLTGAPISATYVVTPVASAAAPANCGGLSYVVTVPINPEPVAQPTSTVVRCSGDPINFNLQDIINNVAPYAGGNSVMSTFTYTVVADFPLDLAPAVFPGTFDRIIASAAPISQTFSNYSNHDVTLTYTVTPFSNVGNCAGVPFTFKVLYHPEPVGSNFSEPNCNTSLNHNIQTQISSGLASIFTYTISQVPAAALVLPADRVVASSLNITDSYVNLTGSPVVVTYTITAFNQAFPTCAGAATFTYDVTISPKPTGVTDTKGAVCSDAPFTVDPQLNIVPSVTSTFVWTATYDGVAIPGGTGVINASFNNPSNTSKDAVYTITPTASGSGCVGLPFSITIPINPEPVMDPALANPPAVCSNNPVSSNPINVVLGTNGASVIADSFTVTLKSQDAGLIGMPTVGTFVAAGGFSNAIKNDVYSNTTAAQLKVVYTVVPKSAAGCSGDAFDITVKVNPEPVVSPALDNTVCSTLISSIVLSTNGTSVGASTYKLISISIPGALTADPGNTAIGTSSGVNLIKNDKYTNITGAIASVVYEIQGTSVSGCVGQSRFITLGIDPAPVLDPALSPAAICSGLPSGITLSEVAGSVAAASFNINSIVYPGLTAGPLNQAVGTNKPANYIFNDSYINVTNGPLTATYSITPVSAAGCIGPVGTIMMTINPSPDLSTTLDKTVCSGTASGIVFSTSNAVALGDYNLISITVAAGLVPAGGNATAGPNKLANAVAADVFTNPTNGILTVKYNVSPRSAANCFGPARDVILTVEPTVTTIPLNNKATICSNSGSTNDPTDIVLQSPTVPSAGVITFNYTAALTSGASTSGFIAGGLSSLPQNYSIQDNLVNTSNSVSVVTYTITPIANGARGGLGCAGIPVPIPVTIEPKPKLVATPTVKTVCEGVATGIAFSSPTTPSAGGTIQFTLVTAVATGGVTGMTANGTVFANPSTLNDVLSNPTPSTQTVTYTLRPSILGGSGLGCLGDDVVVTINVNPRPVASSSVQAPICSGDQVNITLSADVSGTIPSWTVTAPATISGAVPGSGNQILQVLFNNGSITEDVIYNVTPTASGCAGTLLPITVKVNPKPNVTGVPSTIVVCHGSTLNITMNSNVAGVSYTWTAVDPNGLGVPTSGTGDISQPMSNTLGFQATLTYTITPTGPGSCVGNDKTVIVTVSPQISATFLNTPSPDFICKGSTEYLIFQFGGQPLFSFTYDKGAGPITVLNKGNVVVVQDIPLVTTTYTITSVTDGLGCTSPFSVPLVVNVGDTDPNFSVISPLATCSPNKVSFQHNQVAGTIYTWRFGDSADSVYTATTTVPNMIIKHTYTNLSPTSTLSYPAALQTELPAPFPGCFKTTTPKTITIYPNVIANVLADKTEICSGETVQFSNQSVGVSSQTWSFRVQGQTPETTMGTSSSLGYVFTNTTTANPIIYEVLYRGTNANCAAPPQIIPIKVYRAPVAGFNEGTVPPFVNGQSVINFTNTTVPIDGAAFTYDWSFGSDSQPTTFSGTTPGPVTYTRPGSKTISITVVNTQAALCKSVFEKTINIPLLPLVATFTASPAESCYPSKITITQSNITGDVIEWKVYDDNARVVAASSGANPVFDIQAPGRYTITLKTSSSITGQFANAPNQTVKVYDKPFTSFDIRPDIVYVPDTELTTFNFTTGANQYEWDFGDGSTSKLEEPKYIYKIEGIYDVRLIAQFDHGNGVVCADTLKHQVVAKQGGVVKIPNAFTPNPGGSSAGGGGSGGGGSGGGGGGGSAGGTGSFNDVFLPQVKGVEEFNLQIYDRWGNMVFESNDSQIGWDGYDVKGALLPAGVYVYKLTIRLSDGQRSTQIGDVTMIR